MNTPLSISSSTNKQKNKEEFNKKREKSNHFYNNSNSNDKSPEIDMMMSRSMRKWEEAKFSEKNIQQRSYHSSIVHDSSFYVFGGYEINKGIMNDFHYLDLESKECFQWTQIHKKKPDSLYPEPLHRHTTLVFQNKMYLYGGKVSIFQNSNKLYSYDFEANEWELINAEKPQIIDDYEIPFFLDSHNAELYENQEMIVFGGFIGGKIAKYSRSIISFNFEKKQWIAYYLQSRKKSLKSEKDKIRALPKKRANSGIGIYKNILYIFGGTNGKSKLKDMWKFDLISRIWTEIIASDLIFPDARSGHSMITYQDKILLFGGIHDIAHEKNDILYFRCSDERWSRIEEDSTKRPEPESTRHNLRKKTTIVRQDSSSNKYFGLSARDPQNSKKIPFKSRNLFLKTNKPNNKKSISPKRSILFNVSASSLQPRNPNELKDERIRKEKNMRKMMLLSEFEVNDDMRKELVIHSPTTEAMKNSINTIKIELKVDLKSSLVEKMKSNNNNNMMLINPNEKKVNLIKGKKPCARDGCSANVYKDKIVIFGGDRHMMTFHDMFFLNLKLALEEN